MSNEYVDAIKEGVRALDQGWKLPSVVTEIIGWDFREDREQRAANAITQRLRALRKVQDEMRRTITAQIAAELRIDRLLRQRRQQAGRQITAEPLLLEIQARDMRLEREIRAKVCTILDHYYQLRGNGNVWHRRNALAKYRTLLSDLEDLRDRYSPEVCERITREITEKINW
jgi:hypothetical protein